MFSPAWVACYNEGGRWAGLPPNGGGRWAGLPLLACAWVASAMLCVAGVLRYCMPEQDAAARCIRVLNSTCKPC